jgi:hypothetical protein
MVKNILEISINGVQNHLCASKTHYIPPNGMVDCPIGFIRIVSGMNISNIISIVKEFKESPLTLIPKFKLYFSYVLNDDRHRTNK